MKKAAILLSRQLLRSCGLTEWVQKTHQAVQWIKKQDMILVSSEGIQTWDMITSLSSIENLHMRIYAIGADYIKIKESLIHQFNLNSSIVDIIPVSDTLIETPNKENYHIRDRVIVNNADVVIPVSIREDGFMNNLIEEAKDNGKEIIDDFRCQYETKGMSFKYSISKDEVSQEVQSIENMYLIHWTRTTNDPWPDERKIDFFSSIVNSCRYPRTAFDTLDHILKTQQLIASSHHMPEKIPTVSFSGLSPKDVAPLMRWRARYAQMSFEPYGIGIRKNAAIKAGVRQVIYIDKKSDRKPDNENLWLTQSVGTKTDWRNENEYRFRGNLNLAQFSRDDLIVICRTKEEADILHATYKLKALPFCKY